MDRHDSTKIIMDSRCFSQQQSACKASHSVLTASFQLQGVIVAIENQAQRYYGLQYHPEVKHTDRGMETLKHFLFGIAKLKADWKLENILEEELEKLRRQVITGPCASADKTADEVFVATLPGSSCIASIVTHYSCIVSCLNVLASGYLTGI